ncbi:MAG: hypothetical protein GY697_13075 [Desulfobacterales bacterium]|nr:hypothetical protein [Desulfobacterales bacterium]
MKGDSTTARMTNERRTFIKEGSLSLLALPIPASPGCKNRVSPAPVLKK